MANTNAPVVSTYKTVSVPLEGEPTARSGLLKKDRRTVNFLTEYVSSAVTGEKDITLKKRPGTSLYNTLPTGLARGTYNWNGDIYSVIGNILYVNTTPKITLSTSTGNIGFTTYNGTSTQQFVVLDGINGYIFSGPASYTQITDANFPTPHVAFPESQDGYLVVADLKQSIFNSNLGDPFTWTPGNFIDAELYSDTIISLSRIKNYFVVFTSGHLEIFYNDGTITSGSPFQRNDSGVHKVGTTNAYSIASAEDQIIFVGTSAVGYETVYMLDGFNLTEIADISVKRSIEEAKKQADCILYGYIVRIAGHKLYILNMKSALYNRTFVFDFTVKAWNEWSYGNDTRFPFNFVTYSPTLQPILQHDTNGNLYYLDSDIHSDFDQAITTIIQTEKLDFGTLKYKDHNRLGISCDLGAVTDSDAVPIQCLVSWSDNDYSTFTTRGMALTSKYNYILKLGKTRRRAYVLSITSNTDYRIDSIELDLNVMGT